MITKKFKKFLKKVDNSPPRVILASRRWGMKNSTLNLKKILTLICCCAVLFLCGVLLAGCCEEESVPPTPPPEEYSVRISYESEYGTLSFRNYNDKASGTYVLDRFPTITNVGDDVIFSHWVDEFGEIITTNATYNVNQDIKISLTAVFEEAEFVVMADWDNGNPLSAPSVVIKKASGTHHQSGLNLIDPEFVKIAKSDNQNYITREEFEDLDTACFTTSSSGKEYVTYADISLDTYELTYSVNVSGTYYTLNTYNLRGEIPNERRYYEVLSYTFETIYGDPIYTQSSGTLRMQSYDTAPNPFLTSEEFEALPSEGYFGFDYSKDYAAVYCVCDYVLLLDTSTGLYIYIGYGANGPVFDLTEEEAQEYIDLNYQI